MDSSLNFAAAVGVANGNGKWFPITMTKNNNQEPQRATTENKKEVKNGNDRCKLTEKKENNRKRGEHECHAPSLHPWQDRHSETIAGPKRTLCLDFLTQRKLNSTA
uniref:Late blight resistance protein n=1 Tax=Solanum tuberosum TaxID=4113 RepID=M1D3Z4_SOLTU